MSEKKIKIDANSDTITIENRNIEDLLINCSSRNLTVNLKNAEIKYLFFNNPNDHNSSSDLIVNLCENSNVKMYQCRDTGANLILNFNENNNGAEKPTNFKEIIISRDFLSLKCNRDNLFLVIKDMYRDAACYLKNLNGDLINGNRVIINKFNIIVLCNDAVEAKLSEYKNFFLNTGFREAPKDYSLLGSSKTAKLLRLLPIKVANLLGFKGRGVIFDRNSKHEYPNIVISDADQHNTPPKPIVIKEENPAAPAKRYPSIDVENY